LLFLTRWLQQENQSFAQSFDTELEQAKNIESQVEQIASLVRDFGSRLLQQEETINQILTDAETSTKNSAKAEKELEKALKNAAVTRKMTIVFLLVATFSLLFLHWYEP
jgi:syntaxin 18